MAQRHWLVRIASMVFVVIWLALFYVLHKILKDRVPEFVIYILAFIWLAIGFFGHRAMEGRIKSWLASLEDE
jgi:MFS superfamily sulfate permease-like transporter